MKIIHEDEFFNKRDFSIDSTFSSDDLNSNFDDKFPSKALSHLTKNDNDLNSNNFSSFSNIFFPDNQYTSTLDDINSFDDFSSFDDFNSFNLNNPDSSNIDSFFNDDYFNFNNQDITTPSNSNIKNSNSPIEQKIEDESEYCNTNTDNYNSNIAENITSDNNISCCNCKTNSSISNVNKNNSCSHYHKAPYKNNFILDGTKCSNIPIPIISDNTLGAITPIQIISLRLKNKNFDKLKSLLSFNCMITSIINISLNLNFVLRKFNGKGYSVDICSFYYSDTSDFSGTNSFSFQAFDINDDLKFFDCINYVVEVIPITPIVSLGASINNCHLSIVATDTM